MSLLHNGALNPNRWRPSIGNRRDGAASSLPGEGDLVGWRYGAWRCTESRVVPDVDILEADRKQIEEYCAGLRAEARPAQYLRLRPRYIVLQHESGPMILKEGERSQRLHDGRRTIHFGVSPLRHGMGRFSVLNEPYQTCSCHGHIWPCQEIDQAEMAAHQAGRMDRLMATAEPGVCAACLEVITTRQKTVTFPEESRFVPGAPGPTFHAGRGACWGKAEEYERAGRLLDDEFVPRLASCPGIRFIHESRSLSLEGRIDCTAGAGCTGLHGPPGYHEDPPCWHQVRLAANQGAYARPSFDCGYRGGNGECIGGDMSSGGTSLSPTAADILWRSKIERKRRNGH